MGGNALKWLGKAELGEGWGKQGFNSLSTNPYLKGSKNISQVEWIKVIFLSFNLL